jgi:hypothetical protein
MNDGENDFCNFASGVYLINTSNSWEILWS